MSSATPLNTARTYELSKPELRSLFQGVTYEAKTYEIASTTNQPCEFTWSEQFSGVTGTSEPWTGIFNNVTSTLLPDLSFLPGTMGYSSPSAYSLCSLFDSPVVDNFLTGDEYGVWKDSPIFTDGDEAKSHLVHLLCIRPVQTPGVERITTRLRTIQPFVSDGPVLTSRLKALLGKLQGIDPSSAEKIMLDAFLTVTGRGDLQLELENEDSYLEVTFGPTGPFRFVRETGAEPVQEGEVATATAAASLMITDWGAVRGIFTAA